MSDNEPTVETIGSTEMWEALSDPLIELAMHEGVLEFRPDGLHMSVKDAANVALVDQFVEPEDFEHYEVDGEFEMGFDFRKLVETLKPVDADVVSFEYDWDDYRFRFKADGIDAKIAGVTVDSVNGSPTNVPSPFVDKYDYDVDVTIQAKDLKKAAKVVDMASDHATLRMGGDDRVFTMTGKGDTDEYSFDADDAGGIEWNEDPPSTPAVSVQAVDYLKSVVGLLDEDEVRFVNGPELPYHIFTTRADVVDTHVMVAPRIVDE